MKNGINTPECLSIEGFHKSSTLIKVFHAKRFVHKVPLRKNTSLFPQELLSVLNIFNPLL